MMASLTAWRSMVAADLMLGWRVGVGSGGWAGGGSEVEREDVCLGRPR